MRAWTTTHVEFTPTEEEEAKKTMEFLKDLQTQLSQVGCYPMAREAMSSVIRMIENVIEGGYID